MLLNYILTHNDRNDTATVPFDWFSNKWINTYTLLPLLIFVLYSF